MSAKIHFYQDLYWSDIETHDTVELYKEVADCFRANKFYIGRKRLQGCKTYFTHELHICDNVIADDYGVRLCKISNKYFNRECREYYVCNNELNDYPDYNIAVVDTSGDRKMILGCVNIFYCHKLLYNYTYVY